ncbi:hypothetical protein E2C01_083364 [Portunus trituberculatus]|uniref:Uncharacterized protein n=1 Tax=Portunus trituberculatus TaxID=210409 RepID=A0A5B7J1K0_PORTR|nr:hypothetical protein [Portunus trituberculatus]
MMGMLLLAHPLPQKVEEAAPHGVQIPVYRSCVPNCVPMARADDIPPRKEGGKVRTERLPTPTQHSVLQ